MCFVFCDLRVKSKSRFLILTGRCRLPEEEGWVLRFLSVLPQQSHWKQAIRCQLSLPGCSNSRSSFGLNRAWTLKGDCLLTPSVAKDDLELLLLLPLPAPAQCDITATPSSFLKKLPLTKPGVVAYNFNPSTLETDLCEASLGYMWCSETARAIPRNLASKNTNNKT